MRFLLTLAFLKCLITINLGHTVLDEEFLIAVSLICFLSIVIIFIKEILGFFLFSDINLIYICFYYISSGIFNLYSSYYSFFIYFYYSIFYLVASNVIVRFFSFTSNYNFVYFGINNLLSSYYIMLILISKYYLTSAYLLVKYEKNKSILIN